MESLPLETDKFFSILNTIFSTLNVDEILTKVVREIQSILKADRCTLYLIDRGNNELYSKVLQTDNIVEIRVPLKKSSIAGYSAITKKILNIKDAYDNAELCAVDRELCFDRRWQLARWHLPFRLPELAVVARIGHAARFFFQALNKP